MLLVARGRQGQVTARIQWPVNGFPFSLSSFLPLLFLLHRCLEDFSGPGCPGRKMLGWWNNLQQTQSSIAEGLSIAVLLLAQRVLLLFQSIRKASRESQAGPVQLGQGAGGAAEVQSVCREPGWHCCHQHVCSALNWASVWSQPCSSEGFWYHWKALMKDK